MTEAKKVHLNKDGRYLCQRQFKVNAGLITEDVKKVTCRRCITRHKGKGVWA